MKSETLFTRKTPLGASLKVVRHSFGPFQGKPARRVSFISGLHGDEMEGVVVCHRIIQALTQLKETHPDIFQGEVHLYPAVNPPALNQGTRLWPIYGSDMNRLMGPHTGSSVPVQQARQVFEDIKNNSDVVVDIHASNLHLKELPQVRIIEKFEEELVPLARQTHADLIWVHPMAGVFESTLGYNLNQLGISTLVVETGICLRVEPDFVDRLFQGMMHLLVSQGVLAKLPDKISSLPPSRVVYPREVAQACAQHSGLFVSQVQLGKWVGEDEIIGQVIDPVGGQVLERIVSPAKGLIFTLREQPAVHRGALLARVGLDGGRDR